MPRVTQRYLGFVAESGMDRPPIELRLRRADGTYCWFEGSGNNQLANPSIRGLVVSLRDITDRRAAEAALRMSEERNRSIVEAAADAIISVDNEGIIQTFNRAAEHIFATCAADAIGLYYDQFLPAESLELVRSTLRERAPRHSRSTPSRTRATGERFDAQVAVSRHTDRRAALLHRGVARHQ